VTHPGHDFYTILQFCPKPVSFFGKNLTAFGGLCGGCSGEGLRMFWSSSEKALGKLWGSSGEAPGKLWGSCGQLWGTFGSQNGYVEHFSGQLADNLQFLRKFGGNLENYCDARLTLATGSITLPHQNNDE